MKRLFLVDVVEGTVMPVKGRCGCGWYAVGNWVCGECEERHAEGNTTRVMVSRRRLRKLRRAAEECSSMRSEKADCMATLVSLGFGPDIPGFVERIRELQDRCANLSQALREARRSRP